MTLKTSNWPQNRALRGLPLVGSRLRSSSLYATNSEGASPVERFEGVDHTPQVGKVFKTWSRSPETFQKNPPGKHLPKANGENLVLETFVPPSFAQSGREILEGRPTKWVSEAIGPDESQKPAWVCYSQSQYSFLDGTQVETTAQVGMTKTLFERQNILQCYQERNFLRLVIAFFDFGFDIGTPKLKNTKPERVIGAHKAGSPQGTSPSFLQQLFLRVKWYSQRVGRKQGSTQSLVVFQLGIIPYAFLFGIFYTFTSFQISSSLTAGALSTLSALTISNWGPLSGPLYSYSIQLNSLPFELLRLSYFSSKIFIVWGFLTIWKGVRPAKSARNDLIIQTRILRRSKNKKRFTDIEGIEKFLPVLKTLVDSLNGSAGPKAPRSSRTGTYAPKGYLFIGPPGTGKTLLAQAVAGEAKVNLICLSASEIQKQIDIGTRIGAIRLRNLFNQARKNTPCILFLDEIDAIGRARNEVMDLKLFTEFLIQMDSFSMKDGFLVIGTTNFLSSLDAAFVRSGRFDRIIGLNYPAKQTRIEILKFYTQKGNNTFDKAISWNFFGDLTKGLTGADLAKIVNESSLFLIDQASSEQRRLIHTSESLTRGIERISHLPD